MKSVRETILLTILPAASLLSAGEPPANCDLVVDESFQGTALGEGWSVNTGEWTVSGGVLHAREVPADQHIAAARRTIATGDAVYELRFRFTGEGKAFHLGFDPAPGQLEKKGHLFSVIATPNSLTVMKHADKAKPEEDPNESLAKEEMTLGKDQWHTLRITTWGPYVTVMVDGTEMAKVSHPTFAVKKPTLVFRCAGDGAEIDDLKVWKPKA